ncbi:type I-E CRISPR-associated protein Cas5/CasD [Rhodococcus sp. 1168]|uniref:type I-E CRISPR-associated protein Cas5/CasD n=1 Tax=Rhodococcus sp. 1168 TaxID=2018041 RepID=UPI000A0B2319|nr:type I-E CRISPR-associated protein Cas5/CasD [Rhodococcus sp. 1168]ORI24087.1 type I-E CRISPR-associated protein Cas5/CasD [Rhodococcus sp. 1168]
MTTLLIRLAAPMQAWGASSRYSRRDTQQEPTKSGVLGLLAAAQGVRRTDDLEHLAALNFGVRVDQPGSLLRDFQVARSLDEKKTFPLSYRYYLSDAVFVAGVEGESSLIEGLGDALKNPTFPLYLGRRSCPPSLPLLVDISEQSLGEALRRFPWQASDWYRAKQASRVALRIALDGEHGAEGETIRDVPVSFDPQHRRYEWRTVVDDRVEVENPTSRFHGHDPMAVLGGV